MQPSKIEPLEIYSLFASPIVSLDSEVEYKKLWQLYNRKMFKSIKTRIPKEEQRTVRIAVIGKDSNQIPPISSPGFD